MKCLRSLALLGALFVPPAFSGEVTAPADLSALYQKADANRLVLVTYSDQSINAIPDSASVDFYRKRGEYSTTTWSERVSEDIAAEHHLTKLTEWPMTEVGLHCVVYQIASETTLEEVLKHLRQDSRVENVEQMQYFQTQTQQSNDPYHKLQSNMQHMHINQVHAQTTGRKVQIAMIDTGVALDHPDLEGQVTGHENFAQRISSGFKQDKHGTAVAGIMVAKKDNATGITGIAPDAKLLALKACWPDQAHDIAAVCNSLTLALAVNAAIKANVAVLNMSLAGPEDPLLTVLLNKAIERGMIVVAANASDTKLDFPASLPQVIAVQSSSNPLARKHQTNTVAKPLMVSAPGEKILTTLPSNHYDFMSGSSMAAAEVSGVIALLLELKPDLTLAQVEAILHQSTPVQPASNEAPVNINANTAVLAVCAMTHCSPAPEIAYLAEGLF